MEGYLAKGKVYLNPNHPTDQSSATASPSPAPRRLQIKWDAVSGMTELQNDKETGDDTWYTIDGRRVNSQFIMHNAQFNKGIYITKGRKIMVK